MSKNFKRGESAGEGVVILGILLFILIFFIIPNRNNGSLGWKTGGSKETNSETSASNSNQQTNNARDSKITSSSSKVSISINLGNARYSYQPYEEYISISNRGKESQTISGW